MHAISISRLLRARLLEQAFTARVLAVFDHACNLVTPAGDVVALVTPQIGDGPLSVVVEAEPGSFAALDPGMAVWTDSGHLRVGVTDQSPLLDVILAGAEVWEPSPAWSTLRAQRAIIESRLPRLRTIALRHAPAVGQDFGVSAQSNAAISSYAKIREAAGSLRAGWQEDLTALQAGAAQLAGLGGGLTPAGDDFLVGVMLWAWLAHPDPPVICRVIAEVAAPRTTTLSAAFLRAAARGECSAAWHRLLSALAAGTENELVVAVQGVLVHGATSGADTLAGFLWLNSPEVPGVSQAPGP
ncbi:MAG: DUF2877 domain-containing protein [Anaerolineae bacterium]|nr:DUF2877 domain-containing protein [Anaerolineae bacterium]MDH7472717.1 DUF2877 domain-containing protein [Anaerolineae bacterium]